MFGGTFESDLNPEDFDSPQEFMTALFEALKPEAIENNIQMQLTFWGLKTGKNPRYLLADMLAETADNDVWEKIFLPKLRRNVPFPLSVAAPEGDLVSDSDAEDLRRMFAGRDED